MAGKKTNTDPAFVQEMGHRYTSIGSVLYIKIRIRGNRCLSWAEVWRTFESAYPDQWAIQFFPPKDQLVDEVNIYHLFVLDEAPIGVNINGR